MKLFSWFRKPNKELPFNRHINADISVIPIGTNQTSTSKHVRAVGEILAKNFKDIKTHGFGTEVAGDWTNLVRALEDTQKELFAKHDIKRAAVKIELDLRDDKTAQERSTKSRLEGHNFAQAA